jgi:cell division protein FtsB
MKTPHAEATVRGFCFSFDIFVQTSKRTMAKYLKYTKNFYFVFTVLFIVWMVFIDSNDIISHFKLRSKLSDLENQREFYQERKEKIKAEREELLSNYELLEKFARERYLMKRKTEDLYVVVEE